MSKLLRWPVALVLLATTALAIDITTPGQTIPRGKTGTLQADLSCTPSAVGVFLDNGATLAMNGHVLDGCFVAEAGLSPVTIRVQGPGLIRNAGIQIRSGSARPCATSTFRTPRPLASSAAPTRTTVRPSSACGT